MDGCTEARRNLFKSDAKYAGAFAFKYDDTTTTNYLYDGDNALADVDQNGNVLARYAATQKIDEPLVELRSGVASYYSQDGLGSVTSVTTSSGAIGNTYTYDSFGNVTASSGSVTNRFQYTGREFDPKLACTTIARDITMESLVGSLARTHLHSRAA